jgi:hypothetical protein
MIRKSGQSGKGSSPPEKRLFIQELGASAETLKDIDPWLGIREYNF